MSHFKWRAGPDNWAECSDKSERGQLVCRTFSPIHFKEEIISLCHPERERRMTLLVGFV